MGRHAETWRGGQEDAQNPGSLAIQRSQEQHTAAGLEAEAVYSISLYTEETAPSSVEFVQEKQSSGEREVGSTRRGVLRNSIWPGGTGKHGCGGPGGSSSAEGSAGLTPAGSGNLTVLGGGLCHPWLLAKNLLGAGRPVRRVRPSVLNQATVSAGLQESVRGQLEAKGTGHNL